MFKKILSIVLVALIMNMMYLPVMAEPTTVNETIPVSFVTELNVNKSQKGQVVQFISEEDYSDNYGVTIPKGTMFYGKIKSMKHSRFGFRRAKARIVVRKMVLPDGKVCKVKAFTKPHVVKGSAVGNVAKGIGMTPVALITIVGGGVAILCEAVTIVGLVAVPPTGMAICGLVGKETKGVNCKIPEGQSIKLRIKHYPVEHHSVQKAPYQTVTNDFSIEEGDED